MTDVTGYEGLSAAQAWARLCERTGVQARTEKVGGAFDWTDFAILAESAVGMALHERAKALRALHGAGQRTDSGSEP